MLLVFTLKRLYFFSFKTSTKTQSIILNISILVILTYDKFPFVTPIRSFDTFTLKLTFSFSHSRIRIFILIIIFTQLKGIPYALSWDSNHGLQQQLWPKIGRDGEQ